MTAQSEVGLVGLAVMGQVRRASVVGIIMQCVICTPSTSTFRVLQNLALNIAEKGFPISVYNRSFEKTEAAEARAKKTGALVHVGMTPIGPMPSIPYPLFL